MAKTMTIEWTDEQWELIQEYLPKAIGSVEVLEWTLESLANAYKTRIAREIPRQLAAHGLPQTDEFNSILGILDS